MQVIMDGGFVMDGASPYTLVTPYDSTDLAELQFTQSADVLYVTHPDYFPREITRTAHDAWTINVLDFSIDIYEERTIDDVDVHIYYVYSSGYLALSEESIFSSSMVDRKLRVGYQDPTDDAALIWQDLSIEDYTDENTITIEDSKFSQVFIDTMGIQYMFNPYFISHMVGWDNTSTGTCIAEYFYNTGYSGYQEHAIKFTCTASGAAAVDQVVFVPKFADMKMYVLGQTPEGGGLSAARGYVYVGSSRGAGDIYTGYQSATWPSPKFNTGDNSLIYIRITITSYSWSYDDTRLIYEVSVQEDNDHATNNWRLPYMINANRYPRAITFFEQRLVLAGTNDDPQKIWHSKTGDYENYGFSTPLEDDDSFSYTIAAKEVNNIRWMIPLRELIVGTEGAIWRVARGEQTSVMTPSSIDVKLQANYGCAPIEPIAIGDSILFIQRGATKIRNLRYALESDGYTGDDLTVFAEHIFEGKTIVDWAYARMPDSILWCVLSDGTLAGMTFNPEHKVFGWHRHETDGYFESVTVVPGDTTDDVYFVVKRNIDGSDVRYVEQLMPRITDEDEYDYFFVDCGLTYDSTPATTIDGLDHLEGETVIVLADGSVVENLVVSGGEITLPTAASLVHVGLPYTMDLAPLDLDLSGDQGSTMGLTKTISKVILRLYKTRYLECGTDENNLYPVPLMDEAYGEDPPDLFTGIKEVEIDANYDLYGSLFFRNIYPVPVTILGIVPVVQVTDDEG